MMAVRVDDRIESCTMTTRMAVYLSHYDVALQISIAAIVINIFLAITTFAYGWNALYCAFGVDAIISVLTASILIWRFAINFETILELRSSSIQTDCVEVQDRNQMIDFVISSLKTTMNKKSEKSENFREAWSSFWLGLIMILFGCIVLIRSLIELNQLSLHETNDEELIFSINMNPLRILAIISLTMNLALMGLKYFVYYHLESNSMLIESVNSFISATLAVITLISISYSYRFHCLDQIVGISFGLFLLAYGVYNVTRTLSQTVIVWIKQSKRSSCSSQRNEYIRLI